MTIAPPHCCAAARACAASEERLTRRRGSRLSEAGCRVLPGDSGIEVSDLSAVCFYDKPLHRFERILETYLDAAPRGFGTVVDEVAILIPKPIPYTTNASPSRSLWLTASGSSQGADAHLNAEGYRVFAEGLADTLVRSVSSIDNNGSGRRSALEHGSTTRRPPAHNRAATSIVVPHRALDQRRWL
jgi:predicted NodU family carbamoyl transferase